MYFPGICSNSTLAFPKDDHNSLLSFVTLAHLNIIILQQLGNNYISNAVGADQHQSPVPASCQCVSFANYWVHLQVHLTAQ